MSNDYLKKDLERVNKKFSQLKHDGEIGSIEKKLEDLESKPNPDSMDKIWIEIYSDVLDLKKKKDIKD